MKNLFKITSNSDNITPLSPNPPPPPGSYRHQQQLRHNQQQQLLHQQQHYQYQYEPYQPQQYERKQPFGFSPKFGGRSNNSNSSDAQKKSSSSNTQFQRKISAPIETSTSIRIGLDQLYDIQESRTYNPPIRLNLPKKPTLLKDLPNPHKTTPYYNHLNTNLSIQNLSVENKNTVQAEKVVRSFSDSSVMMEKIQTSSTSFPSPQPTASASTFIPERATTPLPKRETPHKSPPTNTFTQPAHPAEKKLRKPKSASLLNTFSSKNTAQIISSPLDYDYLPPKNNADKVVKIDHFGLLSPISPLSPLILNSPTGQSSLLKSVTNDSVSTSTSTSSPLSRQPMSQKSPLASSHSDHFEQYLSDTLSIFDKQELALNSNFSVSQQKLCKSPELGVNPTIDDPAIFDSAFMSDMSQMEHGFSEQFSQVSSPCFSKKNSEMSYSQKPNSLNLKSSLPLLPQSKDFGANDKHRHKESTSTFSSEASEKMSVISHTTRASSVSSGFGHSRQSSKNQSFDATESIFFKPNHKPDNSMTFSESFDDDTFLGSQTKMPKHFHKKSNSLNDVTINLAPHSSTLPINEAQIGTFEKYEKPLPLPQVDPNLKDLDQRGLMITTPVPPPRSKFRALSIDKEHTGIFSNVPPIPKNAIPPTPNSNFYDGNYPSNPSLPTPPQSDSVSPMSQENSVFSPNQESLYSHGTSAASSRNNSKSSQKSVPYYFNKDLPDLPGEDFLRKNSHKKPPHLDLPTPKIPPGNASRTSSVCDWECINNNLDAINMSICKWDQSQNICNDTHNLNNAKKSQLHNLSVSEPKPSGGFSQASPRAIDISSMERSPPSKQLNATQKHSLKGYDLTGKINRSKHHRQKSNPTVTLSHNSLNLLVPPPAIGDLGTTFGTHKKSASTASSPSSVYTEFHQSYTPPSISVKTDSLLNAEYISSSSDPRAGSQSFNRQQVPRSMSVPVISVNQQQSLSKFKKDSEYECTQKNKDIEEESLLPAPWSWCPGVNLLPSASSSTSSLQQKFGSYQQSDPLQSNHFYQMENNSASRIAGQAFSATSCQRDSFTTTFTEAISMPNPIKDIPQRPISPPFGSISAFTSPRTLTRGPTFAKPMTVNGKASESLKQRSNSTTAMVSNIPEVLNKGIHGDRVVNSFDKCTRERSMSVSRSNHQRVPYNSSASGTKDVQSHTLRKPGSLNNLRNPFSTFKQSSSNEGVFGESQTSSSRLESPPPTRFYNENPSPFSSPNAPEFFMNHNGSILHLNPKKISPSSSSCDNALYSGEMNISTGILNPVTTIHPSNQPIPLNSGGSRWKWKRPSLSIGKK